MVPHFSRRITASSALQILRGNTWRTDGHSLKSLAGAGAFAAASGLATPAISQRASARTLRFVPQADLANFDPVRSSTIVVRNASTLT